MSEREKIILIIDDTPEYIQLVSGVLKEKYKIKAATSGEKGLQIAGKKPSPDLILLDVLMPEMDGYEAFQYLKENPETKSIPIVFISGNLSDDEEKKGIDMGAVAYLRKPIDSDKLLITVEESLR